LERQGPGQDQGWGCGSVEAREEGEEEGEYTLSKPLEEVRGEEAVEEEGSRQLREIQGSTAAEAAGVTAVASSQTLTPKPLTLKSKYSTLTPNA